MAVWFTAPSNAERGQDDNAHQNLKQAKRVLRKADFTAEPVTSVSEARKIYRRLHKLGLRVGSTGSRFLRAARPGDWFRSAYSHRPQTQPRSAGSFWRSSSCPACTAPGGVERRTIEKNKLLATLALAEDGGSCVQVAPGLGCSTEIVAFSDKANEFRDVNCEVVAVSVDSHFSHLAWINTPRKNGGLGHMNIALLSDLTKQISRDYGVLLEGPGLALRGLFIIDPNGVIKHLSVNDLPVGRSVEETLRLVKAFQFVEIHGEVCPANWTPDSPTIKPNPTASKEYFEKVNQ
nr:thioredoxin-dependent peroxide reductase, mitochondrial-like [Microcebus murinus]